ncbi:MAG: ImuA family protein [Reyranellaceae bacterium]
MHSASLSDIAALRERINVLEQRFNVRSSSPDEVVALGVTEIDQVLPEGGLSIRGLHEIEGVSPYETTPTSAATGFAAWLLGRCGQARRQNRPILWVRRRGGRFDSRPYAIGLQPYFDPSRLLLVEADSPEQLLWTMEEGLRSGVAAAVLGEVKSADLTATRRLQLSAESTATPALLLRLPGALRTSAALTRWQISSAPAASTPGLHDIARPRLRVSLRRARGLTDDHERSWMMEWCHEKGDFAVVSQTLDRSAGPPRPQLARAAWSDSGQRFRRAAAGFRQ